MSDCSRFWQCAGKEPRLFECATCQNEIGNNPSCKDSWALYFDETELPGPVCGWPANVKCRKKIIEAECWNDTHCEKCGEGFHCQDRKCFSSDGEHCNWCSEPADCAGTKMGPLVLKLWFGLV